jgi:hypothetical protein
LSFGNLKIFSGVQEILTLALMMIFVFALFYFDISMVYKISIGAIVFGVIFLTTIATSILRQQKEARRQQQAAA